MSATGIGAIPSADATSATPATSTQPAQGATPPAASTTPPAAPPPATGDPAALGDAGQRALQAERQAAADARREATEAKAELEALKVAGQSDQEKAITAARKEAAAEVRAELQGQIRSMHVMTQLQAAGMPEGRARTYAASPAFAQLKVEDGQVAGLPEAIDKLKADDPGLFGAPPAPEPGGAWGGGQGGSGKTQPATLDEAVAAEYAKRK